MNLLERERAKYEDAWAIPQYAELSPGEHLVKVFLQMAPATTLIQSSVLDAGAGSGKGALKLDQAGFRVTMCDLTDAGLIPEAQSLPFYSVCLWHSLRRVVGFHDWVYCTDVMEHIPPEFTMLVVSRLLEVARKGVFLSITFLEDNFGRIIGETLHQTVQPYTWWKSRLETMATIRESRDLINSGVFLLEPRA